MIIVLLLITYRGPVLWLLPIISARVSLTVAQAVIYLLTQHGLVVNGQSGGILVVLVLGASTDYALLLVARYREGTARAPGPARGDGGRAAAGKPGHHRQPAPSSLGMLCLLVAESADISGLGPVAAIGIAVGLLAMITLLQALLVITGRWVFWPLRHGMARGADHPRLLGEGRPPHSGQAPCRVGDDRRAPRLRVARPHRLQGGPAHQRPVVPRHPGLDRRRAGARPALPGGAGSRSRSSATLPPRPSCGPRSPAPKASRR